MMISERKWVWRGLAVFAVVLGCLGVAWMRSKRLNPFQPAMTPQERVTAEQSRRNLRLVLAIREGKTEDALAALKDGADPNARGYLVEWPKEMTTTSIPFSKEGTQYVLTMRDSTPESSKFPALMIAAYHGNVTMVKALLEKEADVNASMDSSSGAGGYTALIFAVFNSSDPEIVRILLAHGADLHCVTHDGKTPLTVARSLQYDKVAKVLKQAGEAN